MSSKLKGLLRLTRFPAVFTAQSDIVAAFFLGGGFEHCCFPKMLLVLLASTFLYMAGMVLNDCFDFPQDALTRPERPLPSGQIKVVTAFVFGLLLLVVSGVSAYCAGNPVFLIDLCIAFFVVLYDCWAKKSWIYGPICMGICRSLNFLLGSSLNKIVFFVLLLSSVNFFYVVGITFVGKGETGENQEKAITFAILSIFVALILVIFVSFLASGRVMVKSSAVLYFVFFGAIIAGCMGMAREGSEFAVRKGTKWLVMGIVLLNAIHVLVFDSGAGFFIVASLLFPGIFLAKLIPVS